MDTNQPPNQIRAKWQKIPKTPNIIHAKYNTYTVVLPIPKLGKENTDPNNYRPIALTMEWMINKRLVCFLKTNNILIIF